MVSGLGILLTLDLSDILIGTDRNAFLQGDVYQACHSDASVSMCCALDTSSPFLNLNSGIICRDDGLCENAARDHITRTACTDPTWEDPNCIKLCVDGTKQNGEPEVDNDVQITVCGDGSYCCGSGGQATSCCNTGNGVFMKNGSETNVNPSATSSSNSSGPDENTGSNGQTTIIQTATSMPDLPSPIPISGSQTNNTAAIAGSVVGGVIGLALIIGLCWCFAHRRSKSATPSKEATEEWQHQGGRRGFSEAPTHAADFERDEIVGPPGARQELLGSPNHVHELEATRQNSKL